MSTQSVIEDLRRILGAQDMSPTEADLETLDAWEQERPWPEAMVPESESEQLLEAVCNHANLHYEDEGWAHLVECWGPEQVRAAIGDAEDETQAIDNAREVLQAIGAFSECFIVECS